MHFFQRNLNKWNWQCGKAFDMAPQAEQERGWGEKHEIYAAASGDHRFYDLLSQGRGRGAWPPWSPLAPLDTKLPAWQPRRGKLLISRTSKLREILNGT